MLELLLWGHVVLTSELILLNRVLILVKTRLQRYEFSDRSVDLSEPRRGSAVGWTVARSMVVTVFHGSDSVVRHARHVLVVVGTCSHQTLVTILIVLANRAKCGLQRYAESTRSGSYGWQVAHVRGLAGVDDVLDVANLLSLLGRLLDLDSEAAKFTQLLVDGLFFSFSKLFIQKRRFHFKPLDCCFFKFLILIGA